MRKIFSRLNPNMRLSEMIEWFRVRKINIIVTIGKFGAVGAFENGEQGIVFAPPIILNQFVDSTGAGDAFMAGLASKIYRTNKLTFQGYVDAIAEARTWGAYACTTLGAASNCPSRKRLAEFKAQNMSGENNRIEIVPVKEVQKILNTFDMIKI